MSTNEQWHVDPHFPTLVVDSEGREVASVFIGLPKSLEEGEARVQLAEKRARLIAQAPAMTEALRELLGDRYLADPINADRMSKTRAILAQLDAKP